MQEFVLKNFPLLPQLDNQKNPYGSCNMTCVAMCLRFLGKSRHSGYAAKYPQFEDEIQQRCEDHGLDRHDPNAMKAMLEMYGAIDRLHIVEGKSKVDETVQKTIAHIKAGKPAIVHTYLTASGHIVCLTGVRLDDAGKPVQWKIADPFGEVIISSGTYERNYGDSSTLGIYWLSQGAFADKVLTDDTGFTWLAKLAQHFYSLSGRQIDTFRFGVFFKYSANSRFS